MGLLGVRTRTLLIPLAVAAGLVVTGLVLHTFSERVLRQRVSEELTTILRADVEALSQWLTSQRATTAHFAGDPRVRASARVLIRQANQALDLNGRPIAAGNTERVGERTQPNLLAYWQRVGSGETVVTRPVLAPSSEAGNDPNAPVMFVAAPVLDDTGNTVALLVFGIAPSEFTRILQVARPGQTGETYAFDSTGVMISYSRFDSTLQAIGLLEGVRASSILNIQVRDPGGDLTSGYPLPESLRARPLTKMAADAIDRTYASDSPESDYGIAWDVEGYRDYRGVPVVGAWTWLPEYGFGVTTELDVAEALNVANLVRRLLWGVFALLLLMAGGLVIASGFVRQLRERVSEAKQLGQYKLEKRIGGGGMGSVYRASHSFLRRPTAVKLLRTERASKESIARFEREVKNTSRLTHPNTVAIYDYGRTPDGIFYYAMEYLEGINLDQLVQIDGALPEGRVLFIMKQACASLAEAHENGLVHRDVKPSNIMLCDRGGLYDFVKVLDFGLVRDTEKKDSLAVTKTSGITGTPLFLSPEGIRNPSGVGPAADIYAIGAVCYYLLTGDHVFMGQTALDVCNHHLNTMPDPPSTRTDKPITPDFEKLVLQCLAKEPRDRPADAGRLRRSLKQLEGVSRWTPEDAAKWWSQWTNRRASQALERTMDMSEDSSEPVAGDAEAALIVDTERRGLLGDSAEDSWPSLG